MLPPAHCYDSAQNRAVRHLLVSQTFKNFAKMGTDAMLFHYVFCFGRNSNLPYKNMFIKVLRNSFIHVIFNELTDSLMF